jgi:hypothetical protein
VTALSYSQLDITEGFGADARLGPEDWIETTPLNRQIPNPQEMGLPSIEAGDEAVYEVASRLSLARESFSIGNDGVYCPVCHITNTQLARLRTPSPHCGSPLLKFGWD